MILSEHLDRTAGLFPRKTALKFMNRSYDYSELVRSTTNLSKNLSRMGVGFGDRIVIATGNSPETVISLYAASRIGAIFVPLNPATKSNKLQAIFGKCSPKCVIMDDVIEGTLRVTPNVLDSTVKVYAGKRSSRVNTDDDSHPLDELCEDAPSTSVAGQPGDQDIASIIFTSGSTGDPKGVTLTHANIDVASSSIIQYLNNAPGDIILDAIPLSFDYGLYQVLMSIKFGGTLVLERTFSFFNVLLEKIESERVTGFPIVPSMAEILLTHGNLEGYDLSSLRYITNTAQALSPSTIMKLADIFPGVEIFSMYGLTECKRVSYLDPEKVLRKPTSVGKAIPFTEIFLVDEDRERIDEPGKVGELAVRGPHIMVGYWNDKESTDRIIVKDRRTNERMLLTGDLFRFDEEGDFYFMGRKDLVIKIGGEKASPTEVEKVIGSMREVKSCIVVPVPDEIMGNKFVCLACASDGLTEDDVKRYCADKLEKYMIPKRIVFVPELPLTPNGKLDRNMIIRNIETYLK